MHSAVSGAQFMLSAGDYTAVVTESGAGLRVLRLDGEDLVLTYGAHEVAPAAFGQLLIPWPNRIERGRYTWEGQELQLDLSEPAYDCAIHGLVRWLPWSLESQTPEAVVLTCGLLGSPGYPFRLALRVEYTLDAGAGLTVRVTALNDGEAAAPYAHGAHPYLTVGEHIDGCTVQVPGARHLPVDAMMIPRGPAEPVDGTPYDLRAPRTLGDLRIDRAFTGLERDADGRAWVHLTGTSRATSLWSDRAHPWLEIYTADSVPIQERRTGLGVEPMTCPPNAFVSGTDVVALEPGDVFTGSWGITATQR
ncbi:aldose 1-epimerase family protein [Nonomuraea sp. NPDC050790]|uniref:aldose 1-epimerase family protein n=1 Tax=Nonomuraea sp. NPDC050790 TaxID=3364371 RepID=UPI0037ABDF4E